MATTPMSSSPIRWIAAPLGLLLAISVLSLGPVGNGTTPPSADAATTARISRSTAGEASSVATTTAGAPSIDPALDAQLDSAPMATMLVRLDADFSGSDAERTAAARTKVSELLATLPAGSYTDVADSGILPIATFRGSRAALEVLRTSPLVRAVGADEQLLPASDYANIFDGAATSNANLKKGDGTVVAVIDSGVDATHPFLKKGGVSKVIGEACFTTSLPAQNFQSPCPNSTPMSTTAASVPGSGKACTWTDAGNGCAHGTHVAGIVAGEPGTPGFGELSGVAPNAKLIAIQVFGYKSDLAGGTVTTLTSDLLKALQWLYNRRADYPGLSAVNVSIASSVTKYTGSCDAEASQQSFYTAIQALRDVGIATIVAAGNSGWNDGISAPACLTNTIGVGAIDDLTGVRASFSNVSSAIELFAPGTAIKSAWPGFPDTPKGESGTSQATPAVAGAWALMRQKYPITATTPKSVDDILTLLRTTGTTVTTTVTLNGTPTTYIAPRINIGRALGIPAPTRIAMGADFACARTTNGTVTCAGSNASGQLGVSPATKASSSVPLRISGLSGATDITAGDGFACAKLASTIKCWGSNASGQLGIGSTSTTPSPVPSTVRAGALLDLTNVSSVSADASSLCAVLSAGSTGTLRCWGSNATGQLGDGSITTRTYPTPVKANATTALSGVAAVDMGSNSACAVMVSGAVLCWGANADGQLGNNTTTASRYPVAVSGIDGVTTKATSVKVGNGFACAILTTGGVRCWGRNTNGQLGNNTATRSLVPVEVVTNSAATTASATTSPIPFLGVVQLAVGRDHSCAIAKVSGISKLFCWGLNTNRQLGVGTTDRWFAAAVFGTRTDGATAVAAGPASTLAVITNAMTAIGVNSSGQLGLGDTSDRTTTSWSLRF